MTDETQRQVAADKPGFFHRIPNSWDDDLTPHEYRLLGHYARVAGPEGFCWEGLRKTAKTCRMSPSTVIKTRDKLEKKGYIRVWKPEQDDHESTVTVQVNYDWAGNSARYHKPPASKQEHPASEMEHPATKRKLTCFNLEAKEKPMKKNHEEDSFPTEPEPTAGDTPALMPDPRAGALREGEDLGIRVIGNQVEEPLKALEAYLIQELKCATVGQSYRPRLRAEIEWHTKTGDPKTAPAPVILYETDARYRTFIQREVMARVKNDPGRRNLRNAIQTICSPGTMRWFFEDFAPTCGIDKEPPKPVTLEESLVGVPRFVAGSL